MFINVFPDTNIWLGITPDILGVLSIFILVVYQKSGGFSSKNKLKAIGLTMTAITWITILI
ncbi:hypothetical protein [Lentilactobacillus fungorum]|uniref:hypothetical protein n=1 Tax=Lentilactobacillus fungorum TaxID=2201250 RepID=UPI00194092F7|nr:hypothetical protein [Lentilactobacillus fungorum]